jgi:hypothetical protein
MTDDDREPSADRLRKRVMHAMLVIVLAAIIMACGAVADDLEAWGLLLEIQ